MKSFIIPIARVLYFYYIQFYISKVRQMFESISMNFFESFMRFQRAKDANKISLEYLLVKYSRFKQEINMYF